MKGPIICPSCLNVRQPTRRLEPYSYSVYNYHNFRRKDFAMYSYKIALKVRLFIGFSEGDSTSNTVNVQPDTNGRNQSAEQMTT